MQTDAEIRPAALAWAAERWPAARLAGELGLSGGKVYADLAAITSTALHLIEIKSARDSLRRLPKQVKHYSAVGSSCTLILDPRHLKGAERAVPEWWGLILVEEGGLRELRPAGRNPARHALTVVDLLWREEMLALARLHGVAKGKARATRRTLNTLLRQRVPESQLLAEVAHTLKGRPQDWR